MRVCHHRNLLEFPRTFRDRLEHCHPFRAHGQPERCVLDVAAREDPSIFVFDRRAHSETGVRYVSKGARLSGGPDNIAIVHQPYEITMSGKGMLNP